MHEELRAAADRLVDAMPGGPTVGQLQMRVDRARRRRSGSVVAIGAVVALNGLLAVQLRPSGEAPRPANTAGSSGAEQEASSTQVEAATSTSDGVEPTTPEEPTTSTTGTTSTTTTTSDSTSTSDSRTPTTSTLVPSDAVVEPRPPIAVDDLATSAGDAVLTVDVLANDVDPDGELLRVVTIGAPTAGTAAVVGSGAVTFTPPPGFSGVVQIGYTIADSTGSTSTATLTVVVAPPPAEG